MSNSIVSRAVQLAEELHTTLPLSRDRSPLVSLEMKQRLEDGVFSGKDLAEAKHAYQRVKRWADGMALVGRVFSGPSSAEDVAEVGQARDLIGLIKEKLKSQGTLETF